MDETIKGFLEGIKVGAKQIHKNMTLYCLLSETEADVDFVTLDEALDSKVLTSKGDGRSRESTGTAGDQRIGPQGSHA